ncbi:glycosyltransferase [Motilimonas cestriensis]|uniref:Glycosyltransferase n=1 Tax=Motilimonas cestriensis TaxID=2742685 RepID=A0ABS8W5E7_9GAMM|nr:glycosyltransferase [Motilimonas cestriensis]MCE2594202.1 glycosyltransferase [Motilimonas cestriensis]
MVNPPTNSSAQTVNAGDDELYPPHHSGHSGDKPGLMVLSSLFPSQRRPTAGLFIQERMFRVAAELPLFVVSPVPWFPLQSAIQYFVPHYRPEPAPYEVQTAPDGSLIHVYFPRFIALPGVGRCFDGLMMALAVYRFSKRQPELQFDIIDSHFSYPEGVAAGLLSRIFHKPNTITMRGTEVPHSRGFFTSRWMRWAWQQAEQIFAVSDSLKQVAQAQDITESKIVVVGNGVDSHTFFPINKDQARAALGLKESDQVLITVGGLVPRKGFHQVIKALPLLPDEVKYLIVGGASAEGDYQAQLEQLVSELELSDRVLFLGPKPKAALHKILSAADVFVLASANEGWANVILEAMACRLPVVASDVGGNREVVANQQLGLIYPYGDSDALLHSIEQALNFQWDRDGIQAYAQQNSWDLRVEQLVRHFIALDRAKAESFRPSREVS